MLIGLSELAGAGKTTAIDLLSQDGVRVYLGKLVTIDVDRRPRLPQKLAELVQGLRSFH